jgi:hypothetical protein
MTHRNHDSAKVVLIGAWHFHVVANPRTSHVFYPIRWQIVHFLA